MKFQNQFIIQAKNGKKGLDVYLRANGDEHYLYTHRPNHLLLKKLKDGVTIGEIKRIKPARDEQMYYHFTRYILKVVDEYIQYDLAA
jgi:hypothetical protein